MPNWCVNKLTVEGPKTERARFFRAASGLQPHESIIERLNGREPPTLDFNVFIPYPAHFTELDALAEAERKKGNNHVKDGFNQGGYEWCIKHWGTKWNVDCTRRGNVLRFETAWSPPLPVMAAMATRFPALTFTLRYYEGGQGFQGKAVWRDGKEVENVQKAYHGNLGG